MDKEGGWSVGLEILGYEKAEAQVTAKKEAKIYCLKTREAATTKISEGCVYRDGS